MSVLLLLLFHHLYSKWVHWISQWLLDMMLYPDRLQISQSLPNWMFSCPGQSNIVLTLDATHFQTIWSSFWKRTYVASMRFIRFLVCEECFPVTLMSMFNTKCIANPTSRIIKSIPAWLRYSRCRSIRLLLLHPLRVKWEKLCTSQSQSVRKLFRAHQDFWNISIPLLDNVVHVSHVQILLCNCIQCRISSLTLFPWSPQRLSCTHVFLAILASIKTLEFCKLRQFFPSYFIPHNVYMLPYLWLSSLTYDLVIRDNSYFLSKKSSVSSRAYLR